LKIFRICFYIGAVCGPIWGYVTGSFGELLSAKTDYVVISYPILKSGKPLRCGKSVKWNEIDWMPDRDGRYTMSGLVDYKGSSTVLVSCMDQIHHDQSKHKENCQNSPSPSPIPGNGVFSKIWQIDSLTENATINLNLFQEGQLFSSCRIQIRDVLLSNLALPTLVNIQENPAEASKNYLEPSYANRVKPEGIGQRNTRVFCYCPDKKTTKCYDNENRCYDQNPAIGCVPFLSLESIAKNGWMIYSDDKSNLWVNKNGCQFHY
jgi:hypothetical protein